jgi:hypothetical protein
MLFRRIAVAVFAPGLLLLFAPPAMAASGQLTDPSGDFPDITRLNYSNAQGKVVMTLKFASVADAQNRSFWIQWGQPQKYQVFDSPSAAISELRFHRANGTFAKVACQGLKVPEDLATNTVKAVVPRSCLPKAPDRLRFKGIATQGISLSDETKLSPLVNRG